MSERLPENQPILVPRSVEKGADPSTRRIEVWHTTGESSADGRQMVVGSVEEEINGEIGYPAKPMSERWASPEGQAELAKELAASRDLGHQALENSSHMSEDLQIFSRQRRRELRTQAAAIYEAGLMQPSVHRENEISISDMEKERDPILERIYKPISRPETEEMSDREVDKNYDFLFGTDEEHDMAIAAFNAKERADEPIRKAQKEHDRYINQETRQLAVEQLQRTTSHDRGLRDILREHSFGEVSIDAVDAIRTDEGLRYDVGTYLLDKLNRSITENPRDYGDRLVMNGNKRNDYHTLGESRMTSRQYASYLALAMIDGSFNGDHQSSTDTVEYDDNGKVINAQHRDAARSIL